MRLDTKVRGVDRKERTGTARSERTEQGQRRQRGWSRDREERTEIGRTEKTEQGQRGDHRDAAMGASSFPPLF